MTVQTKTIGRMPTDHGPYDPQLAYGKKFQCELFGCVWESLHDNNNTAPAVWDGGDIITPNLVDWKKASGSYEAWLMNKDKPATTGTTGDYPYNGMGRVKLAKNIVNGVNTLTQDMFYKGAVGSRVPNTNTIFVIQYDFTLGEDITVPANCVLEFDGGSISGAYTITGQNTGIKADIVKIFNTNVTLSGSWNVAEAYPEWFGAIGDRSTDCTSAIQKAINLCDKVKILNGNYLISDTLHLRNKQTLEGISCSKSIITGAVSNTIKPLIQIGETVAMDFTFIKNIHFECVTGGQWDGVYTTRPVTIAGCEFNFMRIFLYTAGVYCDRVIVDNTFFGYGTNPDGYSVILGSELGDGSYFTHTHFIEFNSKGILIQKTNSTTFDTCIINTDITLERTVNTLFNNLHCEGGHLYINGSSCNIENGWFYKRNKSAIVIQDGSSGNYGFSSNVKLSNIQFSYYAELDNYTEIEPEIQIDSSSTVIMDNVFRVDNRGESGTQLFYGIETNIQDFNDISCYASIHSIINSGRVFDVSYTVDSYGNAQIYYGRGLRKLPEGNTEYTVDMTYNLYNLFDYGRKICLSTFNFVVQASDADYCMGEVQYSVTAPSMILVHKYNTNSGINKYAVYANNTVGTRYSNDAGNHINGSTFKDASNYDFSAINMISLVKLLGCGNVWCKADAIPTYGVWKIGDKVLLSTNNKEYTYNGSTWVDATGTPV